MGLGEKAVPEGVRLNELSERVYQSLSKFTAFPWPVMLAQCRRCELDPQALDSGGLRAALPHIVSSVARFTTPAKGESLRRELEALLTAQR